MAAIGNYNIGLLVHNQIIVNNINKKLTTANGKSSHAFHLSESVGFKLTLTLLLEKSYGCVDNTI